MFFSQLYKFGIFRQMSKDLVYTISTLEKEHKLVVLQMQAINELWKKVFIYIIIIYFHFLVFWLMICNILFLF